MVDISDKVKIKHMKVSVIIPCYNVALYISDCLSSVLGQSAGLESMEIILVDDCSTDRTVRILREYEEKYPENIILVLSEENGRQGRARNTGLQYASGDYVLFIDADDYVHPRMIEILGTLANENNLDLLQFRYIDSRKADPEKPLPEMTITDLSDQETRRQVLLRTDILGQSCTTLFYRRALLEKAGVHFAEGVAYEEPLFTYPLKFYAERVGVLEYPLYYYRLNEQGTTASYMSKASTITDHLLVQQAVLDLMRQTPFYETYKSEIDLYYLHSFYAEPFYFMQYRGTCVPSALFRYMAGKVKQNVPDFMKNPYLEGASMEEERELLNLIVTYAEADDAELGTLLRQIRLEN